MAILSMLYRFLNSTAELFTTSGTTALTSDSLDLGTSSENLGNGATDLYWQIVGNGGTAAAGASFLFELMDCATTNGTFVVVASKTVLLADALKTGADLVHDKLPAGLKRFLRIRITGAASMTGALNCKAHVSVS